MQNKNFTSLLLFVTRKILESNTRHFIYITLMFLLMIISVIIRFERIHAAQEKILINIQQNCEMKGK